MRAEEQLQYMSDFYSRIFPTRKHALNQLFCVIGNGFDWVSGELISDDNKYEKRYKLVKLITKAEFPNEEIWKQQHKFFTELYEGEESKIPIEYRFEWYPLCKRFSYLYNYPDDIKPDWKELLEECRRMLQEDGIEV